MSGQITALLHAARDGDREAFDALIPAEVLGVSEATVKRDWAAARAWLNRELSRDRGTGP